MNFKRELNSAQHIQEVENSQGWRETCKILDYVTGFWWLGVLGALFNEFSVLAHLAFISPSSSSIPGKGWGGSCSCRPLSPPSC